VRTGRLLYNPASGRLPAKPYLQRAAKVLAQFDWDVDLIDVGSPKNLHPMSVRAVEDGCDAIFVAGGDGTVGTVASALAGSSTALGILPTGTMNVFAQELGLQRFDLVHLDALEKAAKELATGRVRRVDLGMCNNKPFLLWAGLGLDAKVVNALEPRERWEKAFTTTQYATQALWNSLQWDGMPLTAQAGGYQWKGRMLISVACNIPAYAGGLLELAPGAKVDDGLLDFWLIGGETIADALLRVFQVFRGTHVNAPGVIHFRENAAVLKPDTEVDLQLDGEPHGLVKEMSFTTKKQALAVLVPDSGQARLFTPAEEG